MAKHTHNDWRQEGFALLRGRDSDGEPCWLRFAEPSSILSTTMISEVIPILEQVERAVDAGQYAAGFVAYEAASAFDSALTTHPGDGFPLIWFGIYDEVCRPHIDQAPWVPSESTWSPSVSTRQYESQIRRIKDEIRHGNTYQVNYSLRFSAEGHGDAYAAFLSLIHNHSAPYGAFINAGSHTISSFSPELFFALDHGQIICRPMKGTAPRGRTTDEDSEYRRDLAASKKDQAENLMIVDMIRNDLGRIAEHGTVTVDRLFSIETYETLHQMTTTVRAETQATLSDIFRALFPCASITGAPKVNTMRLIRQLEPDARGIYTGTVGYVSPGPHAQFNVAIRTIVTDDQRAVYGAGSGIVWDSSSSNEYQECLTKARVVREPPTVFELLETLRWTPEESYFLQERHLQRMSASAAHFLFDFDETAVRHELELFAEKLAEPSRVRLTLSKRGETAIAATRLAAPSIQRVTIAHSPVDATDTFLYHKTTRRALYEGHLAECADFDDVILCNSRGEATESCTANLVAASDGIAFTPPVECGLLNGTYRQALIASGQLTERRIRVSELGHFDEIYLINSVRGRIDIDVVDT